MDSEVSLFVTVVLTKQKACGYFIRRSKILIVLNLSANTKRNNYFANDLMKYISFPVFAFVSLTALLSKTSISASYAMLLLTFCQ